MDDLKTSTSLSTNGLARRSRKGVKREWKDLPTDVLSEGFDQHTASYTVGRTPLSWKELPIGAVFSRSKSGRTLHIKLDAAKAICLDTLEAIEVAPKIRVSLQVWKVTSFNSTTT